MPGILNWALDGLDRLIANGRFTVPRSSEDATTMMMDLASPVPAFVRERCECGPDKVVDKDSLYFSWKLWAESNGHHAGAKITFGRSLHAAVPGLGRADIPVGNKRVHGYRGIGLLGGSGCPENNSDHHAQPAQNGEPASQNGFDGKHHSAQLPTSPSAADKPRCTAQAGAQDDAKQNHTSGTPAHDAHDENQCRSNNGHPGRLTIVPSTQHQMRQDNPGTSGSADFVALRRRLGIEPADPGDTATATAADGKPAAPIRINGRPIDRSAHYKASGKGGRRSRRR
jgi:putative DNA primase/helicase